MNVIDYTTNQESLERAVEALYLSKEVTESLNNFSNNTNNNFVDINNLMTQQLSNLYSSMVNFFDKRFNTNTANLNHISKSLDNIMSVQVNIQEDINIVKQKLEITDKTIEVLDNTLCSTTKAINSLENATANIEKITKEGLSSIELLNKNSSKIDLTIDKTNELINQLIKDNVVHDNKLSDILTQNASLKESNNSIIDITLNAEGKLTQTIKYINKYQNSFDNLSCDIKSVVDEVNKSKDSISSDISAIKYDNRYIYDLIHDVKNSITQEDNLLESKYFNQLNSNLKFNDIKSIIKFTDLKPNKIRIKSIDRFSDYDNSAKILDIDETMKWIEI